MMLRRCVIAITAGFATWAAQAYDGLVEKKVFSMPSYTTIGGKAIKNVRVGFETYGKLNAERDNVVLVAHYFSGNSHAAGKYRSDDKAPGYWDAIIGSGKPVDTDKWFVISVDSLVNANTKDPNTTTTGPASIDPGTGKPYGMNFPVVTIRDFVNVQKAVLDSLGIKKLRAAIGPSMGSLQALEWAAAYPDAVDRVIGVIPGGVEAEPYLIAQLDRWAEPIRRDPNWNHGNYYGRAEPTTGAAETVKSITLDARHHGWAGVTYGRKWADPAKNPLDEFDNTFAITDVLAKATTARAAVYDANSLLYLIKANQLYQVGHLATTAEGIKRIKAKVMFVPAKSDLLFFPDYAKKATDLLRAQGNEVEMFEIEGHGGHLDGVFAVSKAGDAIRAFLEK